MIHIEVDLLSHKTKARNISRLLRNKFTTDLHCVVELFACYMLGPWLIRDRIRLIIPITFPYNYTYSIHKWVYKTFFWNWLHSTRVSRRGGALSIIFMLSRGQVDANCSGLITDCVLIEFCFIFQASMYHQWTAKSNCFSCYTNQYIDWECLLLIRLFDKLVLIFWLLSLEYVISNSFST